MKKCHRCGSDNNSDSLYCQRCGEKLDSRAASKDDEEFEESLRRARERFLSRNPLSGESLKNEKDEEESSHISLFPNENTPDESGNGKDLENETVSSKKSQDKLLEKEISVFSKVPSDSNDNGNKSTISYKDEVIGKDGDKSYEPRIRRITITSGDNPIYSDDDVKIYEGPAFQDRDVKIYSPAADKEMGNPRENSLSGRRNSPSPLNEGEYSYSQRDGFIPQEEINESFDDNYDEVGLTDVVSRIDAEETRRKVGFLISVILGLILLVGLGSVIYRYVIQDIRALSVVEDLVEEEKYSEAIAKYDKILEKGPSDAVSERRSNAQNLLAEKTLVTKDPSLVTASEFKTLMDLGSNSEKYAHEAKVQAENVSKFIAGKVKEEIGKNRYQEAKSILEPYIASTASMPLLNEQDVIIKEYFRNKENSGVLENNNGTDEILSSVPEEGTESSSLQEVNSDLKKIMDILEKEKNGITKKNEEAGRPGDYNILTTQYEWELGHEDSEVGVSLNDFIDNYLHFMAEAVTKGEGENLGRFIEEGSEVYTLQKNYIGRTGNDKKTLKFTEYRIDNIISKGDYFEVKVSEVFQVTDSQGKMRTSNAVMVYIIERKPSYYGWVIKSFRAE